MVEQGEIHRGFIREVAVRIKGGIQEVPTYARQLRQFAIEQPVTVGLAVAAAALGLYVFGSSSEAALNRQFLLPRIGIAAIASFALSIPISAIVARSEKRRRENAEDIERNDIMSGLL